MQRLWYFFLVCVGTNLYPLIYKITIWEHATTGQQVYVMHDLHGDLPDLKLTTEQASAIVQVAKEHNALVVYEGMADYQGDNPLCSAVARSTKESHGKMPFAPLKLLDYDVADNFDSTGIPAHEWLQGVMASPLAILNPSMACAGVAYQNIEFRYLMNATIWGSATFGQFFQSVEEILNAIESFNDGDCYTAFYQERVAHFKQVNEDVYKHKQLRVKLRADLPLYHNVVSGPTMRGFTFGVELLEALAVHALCTAPAGKLVMVIMGGLHAQEMDNVMPSLGYETKSTHGTRFWIEESSIMRHAAHPLNIAQIFSAVNIS